MASKWPSPTECWNRLRAAQPPNWVLDHVAAVESLAVAFAQRAADQGHPVDVALVQCGAILHDIGRSLTQDPTHAFAGARILDDESWPEAIVRIVERHTGAGLTAEDADGLGLPRALIPETMEEQLVAHADNLFSGAKRLQLPDVQAKYHAKGLDAAFERIVALHGRVGQWIGTDPDSVDAELP